MTRPHMLTKYHLESPNHSYLRAADGLERGVRPISCSLLYFSGLSCYKVASFTYQDSDLLKKKLSCIVFPVELRDDIRFPCKLNG
jgi:hypothetical protein